MFQDPKAWSPAPVQPGKRGDSMRRSVTLASGRSGRGSPPSACMPGMTRGTRRRKHGRPSRVRSSGWSILKASCRCRTAPPRGGGPSSPLRSASQAESLDSTNASSCRGHYRLSARPSLELMILPVLSVVEPMSFVADLRGPDTHACPPASGPTSTYWTQNQFPSGSVSSIQ